MAISENTLSIGLLKQTMNHSRDAILLIDAETMTVNSANVNALRILGYTDDEITHVPLNKIECALQDVFFWTDLANINHPDRIIEAESEWLTKDGRAVPIAKRVAFHQDAAQRFWIIYAEDISYKREQQEKQVRLVSQLQSSLEATAEGILSVDNEGNVLNVNRRFIRMWHIEDELLATHKVEPILSFMVESLQEADGFKKSLNAIEIEPNRDSEDVLPLLDGRYFVCVSKPVFLRDRSVGRVYSIRDITEMKLVEQSLMIARDTAERASKEKSRMLEALLLSESRLRRLVNSSLIGIMQGNNHAKVTEANDVLLQMVGIERQVFNEKGLNWRDRVAPEFMLSFDTALYEVQKQGQSKPFECDIVGKDFSRIPVLIGMSQLAGSADEWVAFVSDLREQKKADRMKSEFISVVSHELRTPLTSIRGALGLMESGIGGEVAPKLLQLIKIAHKNSQRLSELVNDLLDMEKLSSGKMQLNIERIDLVLYARQAIDANASFAQGLNVNFRLLHHPEQAWVSGDSVRVMQVFANLLSNAARFAPAGDFVDIRIKQLDGAFKVEVEDRGPGIPLSFRDQIFKKFAQADGTNTRQQGGTGLGLNITKTFVEKMGGEIGFVSEVGKGTTFWFTLVAATTRRGDMAE